MSGDKVKENKYAIFNKMIGEMPEDELRALIEFCGSNYPFNKLAVDSAINELRKRNEKHTA